MADLEKAKEYHEWALEIKKEQLGSNHVNVAMSYNNLGNVYSDTGDLEKAKKYHEWALQIRKEQWTFPPLDKILKKFKIGKNFTTA